MRIQKSSQIADMISDYNNVTEVLTNDMSSPILRYVRASGDEIFASVIENMEKVARLTTGISIQVGLNAGTIKPEDLIPELLHFGAVTLDQINSMDPAKLQGAMTSLKGLSGSLKDDQSTQNLEAKLEKIEEIRKIVKVSGDGSKWVGKEKFKQDMEKMKNDGVDLKLFLEADGYVDGFINELNKLTTEQLSEDSLQDFKSYLKFARGNLEKMNVAVGKLKAAPKVGFATMETTGKGLGPLLSLKAAVEAVSDKTNTIMNEIPDESKIRGEYVKSLQVLSDLSNAFGEVDGTLKIVKDVVESRAFPNRISMKWPGFSNGFWAIDEMFDDLSDPWLKKVIQIDTIGTALIQLKGLYGDFKKVDSILGPAGDEKSTMISNLYMEIERIRKVPTNSKEMATAIQELLKCPSLGKDSTPNTSGLTKLIDSAKVVDEKLKEVNNRIGDLVKALEESKELADKFLKTSKSVNNLADMQTFIGSLKTSEDVKNLKVKMEEAQALDRPKAPKQEAQTVLGNIAGVDTYIASIAPIQKLIGCLFSLEDAKAKLVTDGIGISRDYRGSTRIKRDSKAVTDAENVINGVVNSVAELKTLKTDIEKVKGKATPESKVLSTLPDPDKHSMTIGLAAQGMSSMKKAEDNKDQVDLIIKHSPVITKYKANADPADQPILEGVIQLSAPLTAMLQSMNVWKTGIIPTNSTVLVDLFGVISSAKAVTGVPGDFGAMAKSVGKLADKVTDPNAKRELRIVQKALETLHRIGLNFASYAAQFTASKDSLAALDVFFVNAKGSSTSSSQSGGGAGGNGNGNQGQALINTTPASDPTVIIVCVVLGILGFGGAGGAGYYFWKKKQEKKKNKKSDNKDEKKPVDGGEKVSGSGTGTESKATDVEAGHKPDEKAAPAPPAEAPKPPPAPPADPPPPQGPQEIIPAPMIAEHYEEVLIKKINKHKAMLQAEENIRARAAGQRPKKFDQLDALKSFCTKLLAAADMEKIDFSPLVVKHMNECRRKMALREKTRVILKFEGKRFPSTFMHANYVNFPSGLRMILAQAPQKASPGKLSTIEKFWWMAKQEKSEYIVMLAKSGENEGKSCDGYLPAEVGQVDKYENLTVTCINKEMEGDRSVLIRTLEVQFVGEEMFTIKHCEFTEWPDHGAPEASGMVINLLRRVRESKTPVIVHCSAGVGRSGTFAYIELAYQILCLKFNVNLAAVLEELRAQRCDAIQTPIQLAFAMVCLNWYISLHFSGQLKDSKCQSIQDVYVVWAREPIEERKEEKKEEKKVVAKEDNTKTEQATQRTEQATLRSEQVTQRSTAGSEFEEHEVFYSDDEWILEEAEQTDWPVTWVIEELEEEN